MTNGVETRAVFADHAQVFMIRGLIRNYKQPIAYTFSVCYKRTGVGSAIKGSNNKITGSWLFLLLLYVTRAPITHIA